MLCLHCDTRAKGESGNGKNYVMANDYGCDDCEVVGGGLSLFLSQAVLLGFILYVGYSSILLGWDFEQEWRLQVNPIVIAL